MTRYGFRVLCEWDIGLEDYVYMSCDLAYNATKEALGKCGINDDIDVLISEGLVAFREISLVE